MSEPFVPVSDVIDGEASSQLYRKVVSRESCVNLTCRARLARRALA
jgi:hypothetical protein